VRYNYYLVLSFIPSVFLFPKKNSEHKDKEKKKKEKKKKKTEY